MDSFGYETWQSQALGVKNMKENNELRWETLSAGKHNGKAYFSHPWQRKVHGAVGRYHSPPLASTRLPAVSALVCTPVKVQWPLSAVLQLLRGRASSTTTCRHCHGWQGEARDKGGGGSAMLRGRTRVGEPRGHENGRACLIPYQL